MLLIIDECVPDAVGEFLATRGHTVHFVRDLLGASSPDHIIATLGNELGAIVVTANHRDFKALAARMPHGLRGRFRQLGLISLRCRPRSALHRVQLLIEWIEFEDRQVQQLGNQRLVIDISETRFSVVR